MKILPSPRCGLYQHSAEKTFLVSSMIVCLIRAHKQRAAKICRYQNRRQYCVRSSSGQIGDDFVRRVWVPCSPDQVRTTLGFPRCYLEPTGQTAPKVAGDGLNKLSARSLTSASLLCDAQAFPTPRKRFVSMTLL